jgi:hypothetical protein
MVESQSFGMPNPHWLNQREVKFPATRKAFEAAMVRVLSDWMAVKSFESKTEQYEMIYLQVV